MESFSPQEFLIGDYTVALANRLMAKLINSWSLEGRSAIGSITGSHQGPIANFLELQLDAVALGNFEELEAHLNSLMISTDEIELKCLISANILQFYSGAFRSRPSGYFSLLSDDLQNNLRENAPARRQFLASLSQKIRSQILDNYGGKSKIFKRKNKVRSIAVILDDLSPQPKNTLTKLILDWVYLTLMTTPNLKINLLVTKPHNGFKDRPILFGVHDCVDAELARLFLAYGFSLDALQDGRFKLDYVRGAYADRNDIILNFLEGSDFDVAITFPTTISSPTDSLAHSVLPVVSVEIMNGLNFTENCEVYIPNGIFSPKLNPLGAEIVCEIFPAKYPQIAFPSTGLMERSALNILDDELVIVSAGVDFDKRMGASTGDFWHCLKNFLQHNYSSCWILIGIKRSAYLDVLANDVDLNALASANRLILIEYADDLRGILAICDIYVHPPIVGGGGVWR